MHCSTGNSIPLHTTSHTAPAMSISFLTLVDLEYEFRSPRIPSSIVTGWDSGSKFSTMLRTFNIKYLLEFWIFHYPFLFGLWGLLIFQPWGEKISYRDTHGSIILTSVSLRATVTKLPNSLGEKPFPVSLDLAPWQAAYDVSSHWSKHRIYHLNWDIFESDNY